MKVLWKLIVVGLLLASAAGAYLYFMAPEQVYCGQLSRLCEVEDPELITICEDVVIAAAEKDPGVVRDVVDCAVEAKSCSKAMGCAMGASAVIGLKQLERLTPIMKKAPGALDDFLEGVKSGAGKLLD